MKKLQLLSFCAVAFATASVHAQAPAAAPATPAPAATPAPGATTALAADQKVKPYSAGDTQKIKQIIEALQFQIKMSETAKYKLKEDKEIQTLANQAQKEAIDYNTEFVNRGQAHGLGAKELPSTVSTSDKADLDKLGKAKEDKWKLEYLELFAKQTKKNSRAIASAALTFNDPDLKDLAGKLAKIFDGRADALEKSYKDLKNPKKEVKK